MLTTLLLSLSCITASAYAQSSSTTVASNPTPSLYANNSQQFYVRTDTIVKDPSKAEFDGLYLYSYHTGAGLSDVSFNASKTQSAAKAWINYTDDSGVGQLTFNLGSAFPWTMSNDWSSYRTWSPMYINAGQGGGHGFYVNETGLQLNTNAQAGTNVTLSSFRGWLVCTWWHHNVPQLFWHEAYMGDLVVPCNCAEVYLCPEYI